MLQREFSEIRGFQTRQPLRTPVRLLKGINAPAVVIEAGNFSPGGAEAAKARFVEAVERSGLNTDYRIDSESREPVPNAFAKHARYVDLAVVGQPNPDQDVLPGTPMVESAFLSSGRPALVVPYIGAPETLGDRVLIAWDAGREAARAVNDALPILAKAKLVTVLAVNPKDGTQEHGMQPGADIALHLARHDVKVESKVTYADDIGVGDAILSRAADVAADLIVMGGYGHSRLRELVLGGATRHLLQHMTVPVLMSH